MPKTVVKPTENLDQVVTLQLLRSELSKELKKELQPYLTKDQLKKELESYPTKEDLKEAFFENNTLILQMFTDFQEQVTKQFQAMNDKLDVAIHHLAKHVDMFENHEHRLTKLEDWRKLN